PADHFRRPEHRMGFGDYCREPQAAEALSCDLGAEAEDRLLRTLNAELNEGGTDDLPPVAQLRPLVDSGGRETDCHRGCLAGVTTRDPPGRSMCRYWCIKSQASVHRQSSTA